jgi:hypothetical protein
MSHTPPELANLSPMLIDTPARNALEREAHELLAHENLNIMPEAAPEEGKNKKIYINTRNKINYV